MDWFTYENFTDAVVSVIQSGISIIRMLPESLSDFVFGVSRIFILFLLGCTSFVRRFNKGETTFLSLGIASLCWWAKRQREAERLRKARAQQICSQNEILQREVDQQAGLCSTLQYVRNTLRSRSYEEEEASLERQNLCQQREELRRRCSDLSRELDDSKKENMELKRDMQRRKSESDKIKMEFKGKLDRFEHAITDVRSLEADNSSLKRQLNEERNSGRERDESVRSLKSTIEMLTKQRQELLEKYHIAIKQLGAIKGENRRLSKDIESQRSMRKQEHDKIGEIDELTEKLQTSLHTAKGRLNRVGGKLADMTRTSTPRSRRSEKSY